MALLTPNELGRLFADAYHGAALAGTDMRQVTEALESIRTAMGEAANGSKGREAIDHQIGRSEDRRLRGVLLRLRKRFEQRLLDNTLARLRRAFEIDAREGLAAWETACADAMAQWRLPFFLALADADLPFPPAELDVVSTIRRQGRAAMQEHWPDTVGFFERFAALETLDPRGRALLTISAAEVQLYHFANRTQARALLEEAKRLAPGDARVLCGWAELHLDAGNLDEARQVLKEALKQDPGSAFPCLLMGDSYENKSDFGAAEEWFREGIQRNSGEAQSYLRLIRLYGRPQLFSAHESQLASLLERAIDVDPSGAYSAHLAVGYVFQQNKKHDQAQEWYHRAIALEGTRADAYIWKGYAYLEAKDFSLAAASFLQATVFAPELYDGYWGLASLREQEEKWDEALRYYDECLRRRPQQAAQVRNAVREIWRKQKRYTELEAELFEALQANNADQVALDALNKLGDEYRGLPDRTREALRVYERIRGLLGESYEAAFQNRAGNWHFFHRKFAEAADHFKRAIHSGSAVAVYRRNLSDALRELGRWNEAREALEAALPLDHDEETHRLKLGLILNSEGNAFYAQGNYDEAAAKYQLAIEQGPKDAVYHSNLSLALERKRAPAAPAVDEGLSLAIVALEKALEMAPGNTGYLDRLTRLRWQEKHRPRFGRTLLSLLPLVTPIAVEVASNLVPGVEGTNGGVHPQLNELITQMRERFRHELGIPIPGVRFRGNDGTLAQGNYIIMIDDVPLVLGLIPSQRCLCAAPPTELQAAGLAGEGTRDPYGGAEMTWVEETLKDKVLAAGIRVAPWQEYMMRHVEATLRTRLAGFFGHQELATLWETESPPLRVPKDLPWSILTTLRGVLASLLDEQVPVTPFSPILERFLQDQAQGIDWVTSGENVRSLPGIRARLQGNSASYSFLSLGSAFETTIVQSLVRTGPIPVLALPPELCQEQLALVREQIATVDRACLVVQRGEIRPFVSKLIRLEFPSVPVLSLAELAVELRGKLRPAEAPAPAAVAAAPAASTRSNQGATL